MRRRLLVLLLALALASPAPLLAQATRIQSSGTLPSLCTVGNIYLKTGSGAGFYICKSPNTWTGPLVESAGARAFGITIGDGVTDIATGDHGNIMVPFSGTITKWTLMSTDASKTACSIVLDIWEKSTFPPSDSESITASAPPTLSSENVNDDTTLAGWSTSVVAGRYWGFNVDSNTGCTRVTLVVTVTP